MSYIEILAVIVISVLIFSISIFGVFRILDSNIFKEEFLLTYVYCGLWKSQGDYLKYYDNSLKIYYSENDLNLYKIVDNSLFDNRELIIIPFKWVNGGTFDNISIEPITFEVNRK
ncbi:MAG: hypothetical protein PWP54_327 [Thermosipho sp. (in: thermotogales)]|nr:hypothetical protein [Thermosipho sp. (in: thermotogales)]MDN5324785.1 hypothetical protein [Thermosipho sp. (in: thermotogales)]